MKKVPIQKDLLRAVELAAIVYERPGEYTENDLADMLGVSVQTLRRDAEKLRAMRVPIHSSRKYYELWKMPFNELNDLICIYLSLNKFDTIKNLKAIIARFKKGSVLHVFVKILKAIDKGKILIVTYGKDDKGNDIRKRLTPVWLSRQARNIYLVGLENDDPERIRSLPLEKFKNIEFTDEKTKVKEFPDLNQYFSHAWGMFRSSKIFDVVLKFDKDAGKTLENKIYMQDQEVIEKDDHYLLKMRLNISYEFAAWVMGWGGQVEVIKPEELRELVYERAKEIVKIYKKR